MAAFTFKMHTTSKESVLLKQFLQDRYQLGETKRLVPNLKYSNINYFDLHTINVELLT